MRSNRFVGNSGDIVVVFMIGDADDSWTGEYGQADTEVLFSYNITLSVYAGLLFLFAGLFLRLRYLKRRNPEKRMKKLIRSTLFLNKRGRVLKITAVIVILILFSTFLISRPIMSEREKDTEDPNDPRFIKPIRFLGTGVYTKAERNIDDMYILIPTLLEDNGTPLNSNKYPDDDENRVYSLEKDNGEWFIKITYPFRESDKAYGGGQLFDAKEGSTFNIYKDYSETDRSIAGTPGLSAWETMDGKAYTRIYTSFNVTRLDFTYWRGPSTDTGHSTTLLDTNFRTRDDVAGSGWHTIRIEREIDWASPD